MEQIGVQEFIRFFTRNKSLTSVQKSRRDKLLARDCTGKYVQPDDSGTDRTLPVVKPCSPLLTAFFLGKFDEPKGLKYLTHDFDQQEDGRPHSMPQLIKQVKGVLEKQAKGVPDSLLKLLKNCIFGTANWLDTYGQIHTSSFNDPQWIAWSEEHKMHPINNPDYKTEIQAFRATTRVVPPLLQDIVDHLKCGTSLHVTTEKLERADFYTNTYILYCALRRILETMNTYASRYPEVSIAFRRHTDSEGRMLRSVVITQKGSEALKSLKDVRERLAGNPEAGDFGALRKMLNGYCMWSVSAIWDGVPCKWNILKSGDDSDEEPIDGEVEGFTHELTFYIVKANTKL